MSDPSQIDPAGDIRMPRRRERDRRAARIRWIIGVGVTLVFHAGIVLLFEVNLNQRLRADRVNPRIVWMGDKTLLEESTMRGQVMTIFNPAPLFLPTTLNFAGARRTIEDTGPPGEIFRPYAPILVVPEDPGSMGLFAAPPVAADPALVVQSFRWPYLTYFRRDDPPRRTVEERLARIEVWSVETAELALAVSIPVDQGAPDQASWPDWVPFELFVTLSATGSMAEPVAMGRTSPPEVIDEFMQDYIRRRLRLDLRLGPGTYRIVIAP